MASRYHRGTGQDDPTEGVVAQVEGTGPVLPILGGVRCVCPFASGLHRPLWQQLLFLLGPGGQHSLPTSHPTKLPQPSNTFTVLTFMIKPYRQQVAESAFSLEVYKLERNMALAMCDLKDSDDLVYTVSNTAGSGAGFVRWPQVIWMPHRAVTSETHPVFNPHDGITNTAIANPTIISDL